MYRKQHEEEEINKRINSALRAGRGIRVGPSMPEANRKFNDYFREQVARGTFEVNLESGKVTHRDGRPVEPGK